MKTLLKLILPLTLTLFIGSNTVNAQEKNTFSESEFYAYHTKSKLKKLEIKKKDLLSKIKKGDKKAEAQMTNLSKEEGIYTNNIALSEKVNNIAKKVCKIKPMPPCPDKKCGIGAIQNIVVSNNVTIFKSAIYNKSNKKIGYIAKKPSLSLTKSKLNLYKIIYTDKTAIPSILEITRKNSLGETETYKVLL